MDIFGWFWSWFRSSPSVDPKFVTKVQAMAAKSCKFVPAATTVISIVATGNPAVATALGVVNAICKAVNAPTVSKFAAIADGPPIIVIDGQEIVIEGERVE